MDSPSLDRYEEQLYSVFKSFDVNNEEALDRAAVLALCDALQLEQRGTALLDTLFERSTQRVTFAQFRSGLLNVLGAEPAHAERSSLTEAVTHSDDDSSGREVAPKFVFGSKKYGRRSRPPRASSAPGDAVNPPSARSPPASRARAKRSCSAAARAPDPPLSSPLSLDHDSRIDCERALRLCRHLRMDGIDRRLVESIFEAAPTAETTVGEFFDRLNSSLTTSIDRAAANSPMAAGSSTSLETEGAGDETFSCAAVTEAWERMGVQRARRLLVELGFEGPAVRAVDLELALGGELAALDEPCSARALLLLAALALDRLRLVSARSGAAEAVAERDRLRLDVAESNRRARLLAQEVDENNSRLEAEAAANLRRAEARHADALRAVELERANERERVTAEREALTGELARRADAEARLRGQVAAAGARADVLEAAQAAAEQRAAHAERERVRMAAELDATRARAMRVEAAASAAVGGEMAARLERLRAENKHLRDRCDELSAALDSSRPPAAPEPACAACWRDETDCAEDANSPPVSLDAMPCLVAPALSRVDSTAQTEPEANLEKERLLGLIKELESSLEQMRDEYERCEEYWSGKLEEERQLLAEEQRASDERLADLVAKIGEYERQFTPRASGGALPPIEERASLELQVADLEQEFARHRADAEEQLRQRDERIARLARALHAAQQPREPRVRQPRRAEPPALRPAEPAGACGGCAGAWRCAAGLRARLAAAERAVQRLTARLAAADLLVKDLYVENCLLGPRAAPPL